MAGKTAEPTLPAPTRQEQLTGADGSPFDDGFLDQSRRIPGLLFQLALARDPE
jgi:hypothetical protein